MGRRSAAWLPLAVALAAAACTGCTLFRSEKRDVYQFPHTFGVAAPEFRRSLDGLGNMMVAGNEAVLLRNGDAIFGAMLRAIEGARRSVNFEAYIFKDDRVGRMFSTALSGAARRGVKVRVIVDGFGSKLGALKEEMIEAGVQVRKYRPIRLFSIHKMGRRTHRRVLVVDGRVSFTGGVGFDERWMGDARNEDEWQDTQVQVTGPVSAQMQAIFGEHWTFTTGEIIAGEDYYPSLEAVGHVPSQAIKISRGDSTSLAKMLFYVAIQSAEKSIFIENAYFLPDKQVRLALVEAVKRGVDVRVIVPGRKIDIPLVRSASRIHYGGLLSGGVKIYEYAPTMMHSKTMVVDGVYATIGTINFDSRSMLKNAEVSLAFYDRGFAAELEAMFEDDLRKCRRISYEEWKNRGVRRRISEWFSWLFTPYYERGLGPFPGPPGALPEDPRM